MASFIFGESETLGLSWTPWGVVAENRAKRRARQRAQTLKESGGTTRLSRQVRTMAGVLAAKKAMKNPGSVKGTNYFKMKGRSWAKYKVAVNLVKNSAPEFFKKNVSYLRKAEKRTADIWYSDVKSTLDSMRRAAMVASDPREVIVIAEQASMYLRKMTGGGVLGATKKQKKYRENVKKFKKFPAALEAMATSPVSSGATPGIAAPGGGLIMPLAIGGAALLTVLALKG